MPSLLRQPLYSRSLLCALYRLWALCSAAVNIHAWSHGEQLRSADGLAPLRSPRAVPIPGPHPAPGTAVASCGTDHVCHRCPPGWGQCVVMETAQRGGRAEGCPPCAACLSPVSPLQCHLRGSVSLHQIRGRSWGPFWGQVTPHLCAQGPSCCQADSPQGGDTWSKTRPPLQGDSAPQGDAGMAGQGFPFLPRGAFPPSALISQLGKPRPTRPRHLFPGVVPS